jgi:UDP-N-acetylglucosamine acyltransferase
MERPCDASGSFGSRLRRLHLQTLASILAKVQSSSMALIHPTAVIERTALIADDAEIGPYCVIGPHAEIAENCRLVAHVHVAGHTSIGPRTIIYPFASLGTPPQSVHYRGGPTRLVIGADCDIRESVTINLGTEDGGGITQIGDRAFFMANTHVAHDCHIGDNVTIAGSTLGGHCMIGRHVFIGGFSGVHQFTRIGAHAMIGAVTCVRGDVIPFGLANGQIARLVGVNAVGMKRNGFSRDALSAVRRAYRILFLDGNLMEARLAAAEAALGAEPAVAEIIAFARVSSRRALCRPGRARASARGAEVAWRRLDQSHGRMPVERDAPLALASLDQ